MVTAPLASGRQGVPTRANPRTKAVAEAPTLGGTKLQNHKDWSSNTTTPPCLCRILQQATKVHRTSHFLLHKLAPPP